MIKSRCIQMAVLSSAQEVSSNGQVNHDHVRNFKRVVAKKHACCYAMMPTPNIQKRDNVVNPIINHPNDIRNGLVGLVFTKHWEFTGNYWIYT